MKLFLFSLLTGLLIVLTGCQCSKVIYPLGNRNNPLFNSLVGKWQGSYDNKIAYIDTSYDNKRDVFIINIELQNKSNNRIEKIVPFVGFVSVINNSNYLSVVTDIESLLQKYNYSDSNLIFFLPSVCILKMQVSEDKNMLIIDMVDFSEKRKLDQKIKGSDAQMVFLDNSNVLLNTQCELTSFIENNKFRLEPLISLKRIIVEDNIKK